MLDYRFLILSDRGVILLIGSVFGDVVGFGGVLGCGIIGMFMFLMC